MKKRLISLILTVLLLVLLAPAALAESSGPDNQTFPYVLDQAGLLKDSQREALEASAKALSEKHGCSL